MVHSGATTAILRRRLLVRLAAGPLLGVLTAWGVALGAQVFLKPPVMKSMATPTLGEWLFGRPSLRSFGEEYWIGFGSFSRTGITGTPWYLRGVHSPADRGTIAQAYGWPVRVLAGGRTFLVDAEEFRDWGIVGMGGPDAYAFPFSGAVVCRPLLLGSAGGGVCFGVLWWVVLGVPSTVFRLFDARRRARRGCCPECGYDLAGQPAAGCPECGWGRSTAAPARCQAE